MRKRHVPRLMPPSRAIEDTKKNGDLIDLHQPAIKTINSLLYEERKKSGDLIDLHQPAIKSIKLKSGRDLIDLHGDEISILSDGTPEVRPEDVALPPSDASDFEDDEEEESRDGENSQLLIAWTIHRKSKKLNITTLNAHEGHHLHYLMRE